MTPKKKKLLIIIIPIITIVIIGIILTILYITTDFLKSNKTLFYKYISQNMNVAKMLVDNTSEKEYTNLLRQNKYESKSELSSSYTEKINTSDENKNNDINKLKLTMEEQSEYLNDYDYKDININFNNENIFRTEYIHDGEIYGLRFPEKFNQFLAVKNNNIKQVAQNAGLTEDQIALIPNQIKEFNYTEIFNFTDEELATIQDRYLKIIDESIPNDKYSKQKPMITVGEKSYNTTAYSVTLTQEQANDIYIKLLEQLKNDDVVLNKISQLEPIALILNLVKNDESAQDTEYLKNLYVNFIDETIKKIEENNIGTSEVKYTVYVVNGNIVRTQILEEARQTNIDYTYTEEGIQVNIQNRTANEQQENQEIINIEKNNNNEESKFKVKFEKTLGDEISTSEIYRNIKTNGQSVTTESGIELNMASDNLLKIELKQETELSQQIERKLNIDEANCVIANNYEANLVTSWVNMIRDFFKTKVQENQTTITNLKKIEPIGNILGEPKEEPIVQEENHVTEVDKNRFNAKFEFYTGKEKSYEDVVKLLEETKECLKNVQVSYSNDGSSVDKKKLQAVKLTIEENNKNEEIVKELTEKLEENQKFTVEITKNSNDVVETIIITANK
ncbi:MAG: hypothetical protein IKF83_03915 [Clostridia bacterium]|nr:hypothetical protein [Clostridia bacterium]